MTNSTMHRFGLIFSILIGFIAVDVSAQEIKTWLDRMNQAVEELSYEGTFVHVLDGSVETMHIVHRNQDGHINEKISSLDGGREIVRDGDEVQCVLPDRKTVLLETPRKPSSGLVRALPNYSAALEQHYEFASFPKGQVAGHGTQVIRIRPKDELRYGYVLWLDQETAMPLKSQVRDETGAVVEQILFTEFELFETIADSALVSTIDTEGFRWVRPVRALGQSDAQFAWRASRLPGGFELSGVEQSQIAGSDHPVEHLVYSDGLATVSVFIASPQTEADVDAGFSRWGSTNAYSLTFRGRKVTAMGQVPRQTVQRIATSLDAR